MSLLNQIKSEIREFENEDIVIVDGLTFNQKSTLDTIYHYLMSQYESGEYDADGFKKYFYNIVRNPCNVATKMIDFDVAHIRFLTSGGGNTIKTWFYERDFKYWAKVNSFGLVLNRVFDELPKFGSSVIKTIKGNPYHVDLRNFIVEQSADTLDQARYIIEKHIYSPTEFERVAKKHNWERYEEVLSAFRETDADHIVVYERYGEVSGDVVGRNPNSYYYARVILADPGNKIVDNKVVEAEGIQLSADVVDSHPYTEFHFEKIPGRWLGVGRVEILLDPQMRMNEILNLRVKSSYWASLNIYQSRDEGLSRNLLTEVKNGEILNVEYPIERIPTEERNLTAYVSEENSWLRNRDELTMSYDVLRGERLPAGTPLGAAQLAAGMAGAYFDFIRENVAGAVKKYIYEKVIPSFRLYANKKHILNLVGEDVEQFNSFVSSFRLKKAFKRFIEEQKRLPTQEEFEAMKRVARSVRVKSVSIPEGFYNDVEYEIDIVITGESENFAIQSANLQAVLQAITVDKTLLTDPTKRKIFSKILERAGLSIEDIMVEQAELQVLPQAVGGGVSRPVLPSFPVSGQTEKTV